MREVDKVTHIYSISPFRRLTIFYVSMQLPCLYHEIVLKSDFEVLLITVSSSYL